MAENDSGLASEGEGDEIEDIEMPISEDTDEDSLDDEVPMVAEVDDEESEDEETRELKGENESDRGEASGERQDNVRVYLPELSGDNSTPLECDESAYVFLHKFKTGSPCLSFDLIEDDLGSDNRASKFPITMSLVGGTQSSNKRRNHMLVMKMSNVAPSKGNAGYSPKENPDNDDEEDESSDEDDSDDVIPQLDFVTINHPGSVNRIRVTNIAGKSIVATWSDLGKVYIWDIQHSLEAINDHHIMTNYVRHNEQPKPMYCFSGHRKEGYALAWSKFSIGVLASGDCNKDIHLWKPVEGGTWHVDQRALIGHKGSVEDIQWSPTEDNVMASCSSDQSIRIWDIRAPADKACMLTKMKAHESDVNVIHWNKSDPLILSGGDDGRIQVWDLRKFPASAPVCIFKHHTAPITSVEWHPTDSTVFAASGEDDQLTLWDIAVEKDTEVSQEEAAALPELSALPPQILFIHQGQKEIKELHWHTQMPGVSVSTSATGFNVFRTISI